MHKHCAVTGTSGMHTGNTCRRPANQLRLQLKRMLQLQEVRLSVPGCTEIIIPPSRMWTCARSPSYLYSHVNGLSWNLSSTCSRSVQ